jgi:hypothetical protein
MMNVIGAKSTATDMNIKKARETASELAIVLELACGSRISDILVHATYEVIPGKPGFIKEVGNL